MEFKSFIIIVVQTKVKFMTTLFTAFIQQNMKLTQLYYGNKLFLIILLIEGFIMFGSQADIIKNDTLIRNYCKVTGCSVVDCAYVPLSLDAGEEASRFINSVFKTECPEKTTIHILNFQNCNFFGNRLGPLWLRSDLPIDEIFFRNTYLIEITDNAFAQSIFFNVRSLSIMGSHISSLKKSIFRNLSNLRTFLLHDNLLYYVESNLFEYVSRTLAVLEFNRSINNIEVLNNITGKGSLLNVQIVSLQGNNLGTLTDETFRGLQNVQSLYIDNNEIANMSVNVFRPMQTIHQLFLRNNQLTTLPRGILEPILKRQGHNFRLAISNNPWHCDCQLMRLKEMMNIYLSMVIDKAMCSSPEAVIYQEINSADFCEDSLMTTTPRREDNVTIGMDYFTVNVSCDNLFPALKFRISRKLPTTDYQFRSSVQDFSLQELSNGSIRVNLVNLNEISLTVLWFDNTELLSTNGRDGRIVIHCINNVYKTFILNGIRQGVTYTVCIMETVNGVALPMNCRALFINSNYKLQPWKSNEDKTITIALVAIISITLCLGSGYVAFLIIRRHPNLLRGSKRIIIVRRREINAVVLPQGIQLSSRGSTNNVGGGEEDYITPLEGGMNKRKDSQTSSQSSSISYISGIEPKILPLLTSRKNRKNEIPPPIPQRVFSVSIAVDSRENEQNLERDTNIVEKTVI